MELERVPFAIKELVMGTRFKIWKERGTSFSSSGSQTRPCGCENLEGSAMLPLNRTRAGADLLI